MPDNFDIPELLIQNMKASQHVAVLTGAGISAESGVPTFREAQTGLWAQYDPQELATPQAFRHNPRLVWEWYAWRRELVSQAEPNPGHAALVELAALVPRFTLITQNVDGLHQAAGSEKVLNLHGELYGLRCSQCSYQTVDRHHPLPKIPPLCPDCGSLLRPAVVWFGEALDINILSAAWLAAEQADLFLVIGTAGMVYPAAQLPSVARQHGALVLEFNLEETPISTIANQSYLGPAENTLATWWANHKPA